MASRVTTNSLHSCLLNCGGAPAAEENPEVILPGQGDQVTLSGGVGVVFKVPGSLTSGRLAIVQHPVPVDALVIPHTHTREDELSYVMEGLIGVLRRGRELLWTPGSYF